MLAAADSHVFKTPTPLLHNTWSLLLTQLRILEDFSDIPMGLKNGFKTGITSTITSTYIPDNHASALRNPQVIINHIQLELSLGRYSGPYFPFQLQKLIGHFRTAPLGVVPKSQTDKFRIIQDLSFPRDDLFLKSVNFEINSQDFPCEWSGFPQCFFIVAHAPPATEAAVFDVDAAYRNIPVHPDDQRHYCVMWDNLVYIDHCVAFGASSSAGLFGRVADAFVAIITEYGVDNTLKWVDDIVTIRYPHPTTTSLPYTFDANLIFDIANKLGWPWNLPKFSDFNTSFTYLGFQWDLCLRTVSLSEPKRQKFLLRLQPWLSGGRMGLLEAQKLSGSLNHCCYVVTLGRSRLHYLRKFIAGFFHSKPFTKHTIPATLRSELCWWADTLSQAVISRSVQFPPALSSAQIFVDASTSWGIGILIDNRWAAYRFRSREAVINIGWAEMLAVELAVAHLTVLYPSHSHFLINSDNQGVLGAIRHGSSRGTLQNASLSRFSSLLFQQNSFISGSYISTSSNPADPISRGVLPSHPSKLTIRPAIDSSLSHILEPM